jgi:IS4 transposase
MSWVKMNGQSQWKLLVTTDRKLSFIKAMRYYQIRWSIEVFFKDCKQNLGLNNCQSSDFDFNFVRTSLISELEIQEWAECARECVHGGDWSYQCDCC